MGYVRRKCATSKKKLAAHAVSSRTGSPRKRGGRDRASDEDLGKKKDKKSDDEKSEDDGEESPRLALEEVGVPPGPIVAVAAALVEPLLQH